MCTIIWLALCFADFSEGLEKLVRILGGTLTTIEKYPSAAAIIKSSEDGVTLRCGGTILNERHVLTASHCFRVRAWYHIGRAGSFKSKRGSIRQLEPTDLQQYLIRVGSSFYDTGGSTYDINNVIFHPDYNDTIHDSDIAIVRTRNFIIYDSTVKSAIITGPKFEVDDYEPLQAVGWGYTEENGTVSEQLLEVTVFSVNVVSCRNRFKDTDIFVTQNMLCSGYLDIGGRGQCKGDSGSPIYHYQTVVGLCTFGEGCGSIYYPAVNVRVSRFTKWIQFTIKNIFPRANLKPFIEMDFQFHFL